MGATGPRYTVDWFSEHEPAWRAVLVPRFSTGERRALVVGPYEGRCVVWMYENLSPGLHATVLTDYASPTHPSCVAYRGKAVWNADVRGTFDHNMDVLLRADRKERLNLINGPDLTASLSRLACIQEAPKRFDLVYIDCRSSMQAMQSAVLAFPLLSPGGVMVLTNNVHGRTHDAACPRRGIDGFLDAFVTDVKVLRNGFHTFIERRVEPVPLPVPCRAEYFDGQESLEPLVCDAEGQIKSNSKKIRGKSKSMGRRTEGSRSKE